MKYPSETPTPPGATGGSDVAEHVAAQPSAAEDGHERLLDLLRAITDNLGEGVYALDTAGRVAFMNPAAEAMLGWTFTALRGHDMHATIHFQHADGTSYPREQCPLLRVVGSAQVERVEDDTFTRRDGSMFSVSYVSAPIVRDGAVSGAVLAFHDTSAHKALDEALRRSEREAAAQASQLIAIFESIADAVVVYDRNGDIMRSNAADAELMGVPGSVGSPANSLWHRDQVFTMYDEDGNPLARDQWPASRVLRGEVLRGASALDVFLRTMDGRDIVLNASGAPMCDTDGNIVGGVLIGRDVTQRRRLERQTREALAALME
ncbi:MAG TPA: PAS domain S-box protein, partial [Ktedonobacterales bacterium]